MEGQMSIFDYIQDDKCLYNDIECRMRPCTEAQGVRCCRDCDYNHNCSSKCHMKPKAPTKILDMTHDRKGNLHPAPSWMNKERCENCSNWQFSPTQPPDGWGIKGFCTSHRGQGREVGATSYCQDFKENKDL